MKIGLLIPCTSNNCNWTKLEETYLYSCSLKTFLLTYNKEHTYTFYIGIDRGDRIYDDEAMKKAYKRFISVMKNVEIEFLYMDGIAKGHLTVMWNRLFEKAYADKCDYFYQCGDDIDFKTKNWVNDSIQVLREHDDIGMCGPMNNNNRILTQSFVSRKHMEIFGFYFPEEIINWFCDDWINEVYRNIGALFPLQNHYCENKCINETGCRYDVNNDTDMQSDFSVKFHKLRQECTTIVNRDTSVLLAFKNKPKKEI